MPEKRGTQNMALNDVVLCPLNHRHFRHRLLHQARANNTLISTLSTHGYKIGAQRSEIRQIWSELRLEEVEDSAALLFRGERGGGGGGEKEEEEETCGVGGVVVVVVVKKKKKGVVLVE